MRPSRRSFLKLAGGGSLGALLGLRGSTPSQAATAQPGDVTYRDSAGTSAAALAQLCDGIRNASGVVYQA